MAVRILCAGDLHLGRRPTRIPERLAGMTLGPRQAWRELVRVARERAVDAVALTGDVVDEDNRFYEAYSALQAGVKELVSGEPAIAVFAVAGNHDHDVLPRLADQLPAFHLLGRGGRWEAAVLERDGAPAARFCGWSFPDRRVRRDPLDGCPPPDHDLPTVGLLHCDCGASASVYAPVRLAELRASGHDVWLLGHIHKPDVLSEREPLVLYVGSPQGLDPGEPGAHGAWLVTLEAGRPPSAELVPLAGLRWQAIDVPLGEVSDEAGLERAVVEALRAEHQRVVADGGPTRAVGCRLCLTGRTRLHGRLAALVEGIREGVETSFDGIEYFVETAQVLTRPDVPFEEIAQSHDPAGLLARRLLVLERREPGEEYGRLLAEGRRAMEGVRASPVFAAAQGATTPLPDDEVRDELMAAGYALLDKLVEQVRGGGT